MKIYRNKKIVILLSIGCSLCALLFIWGGWNTNEGNMIRSRRFSGEISSGAAVFLKLIAYGIGLYLAMLISWLLFFDFFKAKPLMEFKADGIKFRRNRPGFKPYSDILKVSFENKVQWKVKFVASRFHFADGSIPINASTLTISAVDFQTMITQSMPEKVEII